MEVTSGCMLYTPGIDYGGNWGTVIEATSDSSTVFAFKTGVPFRLSRDSGENWEDLSIASGAFALSSDEKIFYAAQGGITDKRAVVVYRRLDEGETLGRTRV